MHNKQKKNRREQSPKRRIMVIAIIFMIIGVVTLIRITTSHRQQPEGGENMIAYFDTSMGTFEVELFVDKAPITTKNFIDLTNKGFYNGTIFHRVIPNFMVQGGDPTGTGRGGPGYTIPDEFGAGLKHDTKGMLSMANAGPNTGGSQFFITIAPTPWLDGKHAIFGKVVKGYDVVDAMSKVPRNSQDKPLQDVIIKSVRVSPISRK